MKNIIRMLISLFCLLILAAPAVAGDVNLFIAASLKEVINE